MFNKLLVILTEAYNTILIKLSYLYISNLIINLIIYKYFCYRIIQTLFIMDNFILFS